MQIYLRRLPGANWGGGKFENVASALGITKAFHSMNVGITDINADGYPDIYISNIATLIKDDRYSFPDVNTPMKFDARAIAGMLVKESDVLYVSQTREDRLESLRRAGPPARAHQSQQLPT